MPKFYIPEHVKKERAERDAVAKVAHRDLCQAVGEADALERQEIRKKQQADYRLKLEKRIKDRVTEGKATNDEIKELKSESYAYSIQLANQRIQSRIEVLTLDRTFYQQEIQKFKDKEMDSSFLMDTLESVETELHELQIDIEVSQNVNHDVNHEHDIN